MKVFQSMLLGVLLTLSLTSAQKVKQPPAKECKTRWFDRDNPSGTGDYELLSQFWDESPDIICPQPLAIEVQTVDGIPASETGQQFSVNDAASGFACINAQQGKGNSCRDYKVRFTCPNSYCPTASSSPATSTAETLPPAQTFHPEPEPTPSAEGQKGVPSPQAPLRPETTLPPVQTPHPEPEETTSADSQKGAPSPQAPLKPETTLPPVQTPHPGPEQTTSAEGQKGGPTPQVPLRPETTLPPAQTPHLGPEKTTILKGAPTPQIPLRPETTLPPAQTPHFRQEQTTILKEAPTPQAPLRPETTLPPAQTPQPGPEQTTSSEGQKGAPTPQVPLRPETTLPPAQTPHIELEQTTSAEGRKGAPTPQAQLIPETTFPPAQTPQPGPEQTTSAETQVGEGDDHCKDGGHGGGGGDDDDDESKCGEEDVASPAPTPDSEQILTQSPQKVCNTRWFDEDDPSGTGDYEFFFDILDKYPDDICSEPTAIEVQTLDGTPASETGQKFTNNDAHIGFSCIHASQGKGQRCHDYQVRFTCPLSFCSGGEIPSTPGPVKGGQDQTTPASEPTTPPAPTPTLEQVQSSPKIPEKGDQDQPGTGLEPVTLPAPTPVSPEVKTGSQVQEQACKTNWFDRDNPSGTGDYELLSDLMDENNIDAICLDPIAIEVQVVDGTPASETGQQFAVNDAARGFACVNAHQGKGVSCLDYQVRFICPDSFCAGKGQPEVESTSAAPIPATQEMHLFPTQGQDQSGLTSAAITPVDAVPVQTTAANTPISMVPDEKTQQSPAPVCKTKWLNRDNPTATGDYELIYYLRKDYPKAICNKPIAIEVQTVDGIPASQTGQKFARNDAVNGFACINADQGKRGVCLDYKVRFTCPDSFCSGSDQKGVKKGSP